MAFANAGGQDVTSYPKKTQHGKFLSKIVVKKQVLRVRSLL